MRPFRATLLLLVSAWLSAGLSVWLSACATRPARVETAPAAVAGAAPAPPARVATWNVVILSRPSGKSVTTWLADGTRTVEYEQLQNGRGPRVSARLRLAADGTIAQLDATGHDTMGIPVDEHFTVEGRRARWQSKAERGEVDLEARAFYYPLAAVPDIKPLLVAALRAAGGRLALLPSGEARVTRGGELTVRVGDVERKLVDWVLSGLDFAPEHVWLDDKDEFFAVAEPWYALVPPGAEPAIAQLVTAQRTADHAREEELARRTAHRPPTAGLAFTHARVLDVEKRRWLPDHTVLVVGPRITAVGPSARVKVPAGAETIDLRGQALLPGLWDMHSHMSPAWGPLNVASGVTTVRDLGNDADDLDEMKRRFDEGVAVGPHVVRAGFIEGRGEKAAGSKITAETEAEALAAVDYYAQRGYQQIKIYNSVKPELVPILARAAHARGLRVSGHVPVHLRAEEVVRAGYDEVQHINMLFLNFFVDRETDTRTPLRFTLVAERAAGFDLDGEPARAFVKLLVEHKTVIDPTLSVFEELFANRLGEVAPGYREVAGRLPVLPRRGLLSGGLPVPEGKDQLYKDSFRAALGLVKRLHTAGVRLVCGTDTIAGFGQHRELELHALAGIPAADVLANSTIGSARIMGLDRSSGSIAAGKDADLVVIDGDPLARIADVRKVVRTVRAGVVFEPAELLRFVSVN